MACQHSSVKAMSRCPRRILPHDPEPRASPWIPRSARSWARPTGSSRHACPRAPSPEPALENLARGALRELRDDLHLTRVLEAGEARLAVGDQLVGFARGARAPRDDGP